MPPTSPQFVLTQYLQRQALVRPYAQQLESLDGSGLKLIIVVPAYRENLAPLFESLAACELAQAQTALCLLIVNQSAQESHLLPEHRAQVERWRDLTLANGLQIRAVDACDLPPRQAGVGLARKIGMDLAVLLFAQNGRDGLIVNLDADCSVSRNYLSVLQAFADGGGEAASLAYEHSLQGLSPEGQKAILQYELWLRYYSQALHWAGYAHWHQTIGSAMASRASLYARAGGMNRRKAAEDFYFLHKLMPLANYRTLGDLRVYPSARISDRVPFGTGRAMGEQARGSKDFTRLYHPQIFRELREIVQRAPALESTPWGDFLSAHPRIEKAYTALLRRSKQSFRPNFRHWFDGFKVLKYVHWRSQTYAQIPWPEALGLLIEAGSLSESLTKLRRLEHEASGLPA